MDKEKIIELLPNDIKFIAFRNHSKASEKYIDVKIYNKKKLVWSGSIPYYYRRTGLFIETEENLVDYLNKIKSFFTSKNIEKFVKFEKERWKKEMAGKKTTKLFFDKLLNMKWNSVKNDLPSNPNWARRIQDIKEFGYSLATHTNIQIADTKRKDTHILLLPIPKGGCTGYEIMSETFKKKAIKALSSINVYELSSANKHGLIPDHKFPEIRWDNKTKKENDNLTETEMKNKFQLLDNQRNQQKREKCRNCFQTNKRGIIFGIKYFYQGGENWNNEFPKTGKKAELGCKGCAWYDIQKWRESLNELLEKEKT